MQPLAPDDPRSIGPYRLLRRLGSGGMGRVYLGRSAGGRTVAVKVVHRHFAASDDFRARFRREVELAHRVGRAQGEARATRGSAEPPTGGWTAAVLDADPEAELPWVASGYVAGPALQEAVEEHGALPERAVRALGAGLAETLAAIHRLALVHRDVKPSNVLLALDGPRLIDFGIARAVDGTSTSLTSTGVTIGSPGYMSPEQVLAREVGPPSDVFSLGAVLAFAATGNGPFPGNSSASLLYKVVHEEPELPGVTGELREVIASCLAKDPAERPAPQTVAQRLAGAAGAPGLLRFGWLPAPLVEGVSRRAVELLDLELPAPEGAAGAEAEPAFGVGAGAEGGSTPASGGGSGPASDDGPAAGSGPGCGPGSGSASGSGSGSASGSGCGSGFGSGSGGGEPSGAGGPVDSAGQPVIGDAPAWSPTVPSVPARHPGAGEGPVPGPRSGPIPFTRPSQPGPDGPPPPGAPLSNGAPAGSGTPGSGTPGPGQPEGGFPSAPPVSPPPGPLPPPPSDAVATGGGSTRTGQVALQLGRRRLSCTLVLSVAGALAVATTTAVLMLPTLGGSSSPKGSDGAARPSTSEPPSDSGAEPAQVPKGFLGTWQGAVNTENGLPAGELSVTIREGGLGGEVARLVYTVIGDVQCHGTGVLVSVDGERLVVEERPDTERNPGKLFCSGATAEVTFIREADGSLIYSSTDAAAGRPTGQLTRSSP